MQCASSAIIAGTVAPAAAELKHSAVTLIWLTPLFIALEKGSASSPARNAVKKHEHNLNLKS